MNAKETLRLMTILGIASLFVTSIVLIVDTERARLAEECVAKHGQWIQVSHDNFICVPKTIEVNNEDSTGIN